MSSLYEAIGEKKSTKSIYDAVGEPQSAAVSKRPQIGAAPEPGWWESIKEHILFPAEAGYGGGRLTKPGRYEKLWRGVEFTPRVTFETIGQLLERANRAVAGVVEPPMAKIAGAPEQPFGPSVKRGLQAVIRKPGAPTEAPTYGEAWGRSWYEPLMGKPAPDWAKTTQDVSLETLLLLGPTALKQARTAHALKRTPVTEYEAARLKPAKFKETWQTVSGKKVKAGTTIAEVSPTKAPLAEKPIEKLTRLVKTADRVEKAQRKLRHKEMQKRVAKYAGTLEKETGKEAFYKARGTLRGAMPTAEFKPPELEMTPAEINSLVEQLRLSQKLLPLERNNAFEGLETILRGRLPQRHQLQLLEREFGPGLIKAVLGKRPLSSRGAEFFADLANTPRTLLTSYDLSASLRQTYISGIRHPIKWTKAFGAQLKAMASEKNALAIEQSIRNSKHYPLAVQHKLYLPEIESFGATLAARPEEYMSRIARIAPGVKMSERAFITMGNKMRFELWSKYCNLWEGTSKSAADYATLAKYLNAVTGRGNLPAFLEQHGAAANAILFSPRYIASRFQALAQAAQYPIPKAFLPSKSAAVSKIAAGDMVAFVAANLGLLAAAKFFWGDKVDVEIDPRSSDFGKMRVGNTRYDIWAGYQPLSRYITQAIMGERKTTYTGQIVKQPRKETFKRFGRSKLSPAASFIIDFFAGTTFVGDEVILEKWPEQLRTRLIPLAIQDVLDAVAYQGLDQGLTTLPAAMLGIGAQTWEPSPFQQATLLKNEYARKYFGKDWDSLGLLNQQLIRKANPGIAEWEQKAKAERTRFPFVEEMLKEQAKAGHQIQSGLPTDAQKEMKRLFVTVGGLGRNISKDWFLNDERYKDYQNRTVAWLHAGLAKLLPAKEYKRATDDQKRQLLEQLIKEAKARARQEVVGKGVVQDLLDIQKRKHRISQ